jgi:hypothetical protein
MLAYLAGQLSVGNDPLKIAINQQPSGKHGVMPCSGTVVRRRGNMLKTASNLSRASQIRLKRKKSFSND